MAERSAKPRLRLVATPAPSLATRIRVVRLELAALEQQQRDDLMQLIATAFAPGEAFSAGQIWQSPELRTACLEADLSTVQQLGVWLRSWCGAGLERIGRNGDGIVWGVSENDLHDDSRVPGDDGV